MFAPPTSIEEAWPTKIWPVIEADFKKIRGESVTPQGEGAIGAAFLADKVLDKITSVGEARNYTGNLAWTKPLPKDAGGISLAKVDKVVEAYFPRGADKQLKAPALWWRGCNIPVILRSKVEMPSKGER